MIKSKPSITYISLIFTSLLSVSLIIISSIYFHQLSVLKRGYQIQSGILQRYQKNIVYQECQTNQQDCPPIYNEQCKECQECEECESTECINPDCTCPEKECEEYEECQICPTPNKSSNLFLLKGTYKKETYEKLIQFQIINLTNTDYTIEEVVCTAKQDQICERSPDNIIILNAYGELELTTGNDATKLLSDDSTTWTSSSWGMPWSENAIKVNLPVYASESDVLLQKNIQKIKSSLSVTQIEVEEIESIRSSSIGTIETDYALSIKLTSVGVAADITKTAIEITNGVSGRINIEGNINCNSGTEACVNLVNINNANNGYALNVSGNVESSVLFSKNSVVSATFTNEGTLSDVVNNGKFNSIQNTGQIPSGIINKEGGTIGDITNQANSQLDSVINNGQMKSVSNTGSMTSFNNNVGGKLNESITNKGTATNMKNEGGTLTNGLQIDGGSIGSISTKYGLSINGDTTIQGSDIGILIGNDGSKDDIKIQTQEDVGEYGILIQQGTIGHTGLHRGINIDNRGNYNTNSPWVNIYSDSKSFNGQDSYAIFVGPNNVKLHSPTSDNGSDGHVYYYMKPKIHSDHGTLTQPINYICNAEREYN